MLKSPENPFQYILTYIFSQDHIELLFSFIRSRRGWSNNPNVSQLKYALRKIPLQNVVTALRNANFVNWMKNFSAIIPFFSQKLTRVTNWWISISENMIWSQNDRCLSWAIRSTESYCEVLFYVGGHIASKHVKLLTCSDCKKMPPFSIFHNISKWS